MPKPGAVVRTLCSLIPFLVAAMLCGVAVVALLPCVWLRDVTATTAVREEMDWLD